MIVLLMWVGYPYGNSLSIGTVEGSSPYAFALFFSRDDQKSQKSSEVSSVLRLFSFSEVRKLCLWSPVSGELFAFKFICERPCLPPGHWALHAFGIIAVTQLKVRKVLLFLHYYGNLRLYQK